MKVFLDFKQYSLQHFGFVGLSIQCPSPLLGYSNRGLRILCFSAPPPFLQPLGFLGLSLCHYKFQGEQTFTPGNSAKLCDKNQDGWKFHEFFLNTPGNSTSFLLDPWNFLMLFLQYPWKFRVFNPPPLFGFFLE